MQAGPPSMDVQIHINLCLEMRGGAGLDRPDYGQTYKPGAGLFENSATHYSTSNFQPPAGRSVGFYKEPLTIRLLDELVEYCTHLFECWW